MSAKDDRIKQLEYELVRRDATITMLQSSINSLNQKIENLTELLMLMRREKYAPSSEQTPKSDGKSEQMSIFNEAEIPADAHSSVEPRWQTGSSDALKIISLKS